MIQFFVFFIIENFNVIGFMLLMILCEFKVEVLLIDVVECIVFVGCWVVQVILSGEDDCLLVVVGLCSIYDQV